MCNSEKSVNTCPDSFTELLNDLCTHPLFWTVLLCSSSGVAAEVHMIWPQARAAAGGVKSVGLELTAVIVLSGGRHVDPTDSLLSSVAFG